MWRPYAHLMTMEDRLSFSEKPDGPWCEGEDGPVRPAKWVHPDAVEPPPWITMMETDAGHAFQQGEKEDLIRIAREAGVADADIGIYVRATRGYVALA